VLHTLLNPFLGNTENKPHQRVHKVVVFLDTKSEELA